MGTIQGAKILQRKARYNENIMPVASGLNGDATINKTGGTAFSVAQYQTNYRFEGTKGVQSYNNSISTPLEYNFVDVLSTTIAKTGNYIFSLELLHLDTTVFENKLKVIVYINEVATHVIENILVVGDEGIKKDVFHTFAQSFTFSQNDVINFSFEHTVDPTSFIGESTIYFDALKLEIDDRNMEGTPSVYSKSKNIIAGEEEVWRLYGDSQIPINYTGGTLGFKVPNDGVYVNNKKLLTAFNTSTSQLDLSDFDLKSNIEITLDLNIETTAPSQVVYFEFFGSVGSPNEWSGSLSNEINYKNSGTHKFVIHVKYPLEFQSDLDFPAEIRFFSVSDAIITPRFLHIVTRKQI